MADALLAAKRTLLVGGALLEEDAMALPTKWPLLPLI
jgi:hypothetical protein